MAEVCTKNEKFCTQKFMTNYMVIRVKINPSE